MKWLLSSTCLAYAIQQHSYFIPRAAHGKHRHHDQQHQIQLQNRGSAQAIQSLTEELQTQQEELQQTNEELEEKANALNEQKTEVERKNSEIEQARMALEEKAEQLAVTSKYKSEFLANMSHELRTPLNSILILAQQLMENQNKNLDEKQVKFAETIHASGSDLLTLINDILDLSKIESGTVTVEFEDIPISQITAEIETSFQYMIEKKGLKLAIEFGNDLPAAIHSDSKRLEQVIKNLVSNAVKFTEKGSITLKIEKAAGGWNPENRSLNQANCVIAFSVIDTGIGIAADKRKIIFEAFQQADSGTSRKYGGTGLGLAISREIRSY
jgi:signal transduction histidine kinase